MESQKNWKDFEKVKENIERSKRKSFAWWVLKKTPFWKRKNSCRIWRWIDDDEEEKEEECRGVGSGCLGEWEEWMKWLREWRNKKIDLRNLKNVFGVHNLRPLRLGRMAFVSYDYGSELLLNRIFSPYESKSKQTPQSFTLLLKIYSLFALHYHFLCFFSQWNRNSPNLKTFVIL